MNFHDKLISKLTELDRRESRKPGHNIYAIAHYFRAADGVTDAQTFAEAFIPTRGMHWVSKELGLGLEVENGRWILPFKP